MAKKIAFIRVFKNVPIAYSVERMLKDTFPEYEVDVFDLTTLIKQRPSLVALNTAQTILTYGSDLVQRLKRPGGAFLATPYMFQNVKKIMHTVLENAQDDYLFSFQLQSLFDTSTGLMPHFVYTDHTHLANLTYPHYDQRRMYSAKWIELERTVYENADMVFTRSTNIKQSLIEQYEIDHGRVQCVYVGVNTHDNDAPQTAARYAAKRIVFVGIDWERKGGPDLIAAFRQVLQTHPDAHLTIVGASPELGDLPNCEVIGKIPVEEVHRYYKDASVFCLPTYHEPFGVVFVEAMAFALPLIATNVGAIPDFVVENQNGFLVPPGDVNALTDALNKILQDADQRRSFGQFSKQLADERYNWDHVGGLIRNTVLEVLDAAKT